jgi:HSP20 family protein
MPIIKRPTRSDVSWPSWFSHRPFEWPAWLELDDELQVKVEEFEDGGNHVIRAELPGVDPDKDIEVTVTDHTLRIRAERRREDKVEDKHGYRSEFHYGSFSRTMGLPPTATEADIQATYDNGILQVRVPIDDARVDERRVQIQHA